MAFCMGGIDIDEVLDVTQLALTEAAQDTPSIDEIVFQLHSELLPLLLNTSISEEDFYSTN